MLTKIAVLTGTRPEAIKGIRLLTPLPCDYLIWLMNHSSIYSYKFWRNTERRDIIDRPVIVLRKFKERTEGIEAGQQLL
jgi:UDP-N-acetylglucosamine 2-epimerase